MDFAFTSDQLAIQSAVEEVCSQFTDADWLRTDREGVQHPLAERWIELQAGTLLYQRAAWLYERGDPCGAEANAAKFFCAGSGVKACETAVLTLGGMGYAKEFHVERYFREAMPPRIASVSPQLILCCIAEKVLGLPKSY